MGKKRPDEWRDEDRRRCLDLLFMCPYSYPGNRGNTIHKDDQALRFIAKVMDRPKDGVERQIEYAFTGYDEDGERIPVLSKVYGLKSNLDPDRVIDERMKAYYAYGRGRRIKQGVRLTKKGTVNPKRPLKPKELQVLLVVSDATLKKLEAYWQNTRARPLKGLWK